MRKELDDLLCEKYPRFYQDRAKTQYQSCMGRGFSCGDGWFDLIDKLTTDVEALISHLSEEERPTAAQVKEKFGMLRFYLNGGEETPVPEAVRELVQIAENESGTICEFCGVPGTFRTGGWVKTLCDPCHEKREEEIGSRFSPKTND